MPKLTLQLASDPDDGLSLELLDRERNVVAFVRRSDKDHTVTISASEQLPRDAIDRLVRAAAIALEPFEDGTPLPPREAWLEE